MRFSGKSIPVTLFTAFYRARKQAGFILLQVIFAFGLLQSETSFGDGDEWTYTLSPGDNIWNIAENILGDAGYVPKLLRLNKIENPRQLPPGMKVRIPLRWLEVETTQVRVMTVVGDVKVISTDGAEPRDLSVGAMLGAGDQLIVGNDGNVVLRFLDETTVFLSKNSAATLERVNKLSNSGLADSKIKLHQGRTENKVESKGTRFEITTPTASAVVRGTDFRLSVDRQVSDVARVEVLGGQVVVGGGGQKVKVAAGFGTAVTGQGTPLAPVRLLATPEILSPAEVSHSLPVDFKWRPLEGAVGYRLQVYAEDAQATVVDETIGNPYFSTSALLDGRYIVRVRAIDGNGLEGNETSYPLELDARPLPPFVVSPLADEIVRTDVPRFEWSRPAEGTSYHLQVSRKADFSELVLDLTDHAEGQFVPDSWQPGTYYWRVATQVDDTTGPFGETQVFTLRPEPDAPEVARESGENGYILRWPASGEGRKYRVQIAADEGFTNPTIDELLDEPQWQTQRPRSLVYFRIRTVDTDGFEGAWSSAQKIDPPPPPWHQFGIIALGFLLIAL